MLRPTLIAIATIVTLTGTAHAGWPAGGKYVSGVNNGIYGARLVRIYDIPGGFYVFSVGKGGFSSGYGVQRLDSDGDIASGWPAEGASLVFGSTDTPAWQGWAVDDSACFWRVGTDGGFNTGTRAIVLQPDATLKPVSGSWQVHPSYVAYTAAAAGTSGDMYLAVGGNRVKRFTRAGVQVAGWPVNGVVASASLGLPSLVPDGTGGVIYYSPFGSSTGTPAAIRILPTGVKDPSWPVACLTLTTDPNMPDPNDEGLFQPVIRSGWDHFIAAWTGPGSSSAKQVVLQRFTVSGTLDPGWPADGLVLAAAGNNKGVTLVEDGSGGVYVLWYQDDVPVAAHVLASGGTSGNVPTDLLPEGAAFVRPAFGYPARPLAYLAADITTDGRLMYAWDDHSTPGNPRTRVRWFLPDLSPDPSEPSEGRIIVKADPGESRTVSTVRAVHSDGMGGAYVAWQVLFDDPFPTYTDLWMTRILASSQLDVPRPAPPGRLVLSTPRPNPARDAIAFDLTLPDDAPAQVALLDIAGRVVRTQSVEGAGPHAISIDGLGSLAPGLYFARVTSRDRSTAARVVVSR